MCPPDIDVSDTKSPDGIYWAYELLFPSGRKYIGITRNVAKRWKQHIYDSRSRKDAPVWRAIRKYGAENVTVNALVCGNIEYIQNLEITLIAFYNSRVPHGYNVSFGGNISPAKSPEARKKISDNKKALFMDREVRERFRLASVGRVRPELERKNHSNFVRALWLDPGYRSKVVKAHTGHRVSDETKNKMKESAKRFATQRKNYGLDIVETSSGRYQARASISGTRYYLGRFDTYDQAKQAIDQCLLLRI